MVYTHDIRYTHELDTYMNVAVLMNGRYTHDIRYTHELDTLINVDVLMK